jgi:PAS domain S-box-containing protein
MQQLPAVVQLLTDPRVGALVSAPKPAFIVDSSGNLLLANQAALVLLRVNSLDEASTALAAERGPIAAAARTVMDRPAGSPPQLQSLPLTAGGNRRAVEFACSTIEFGGRKAIVLAGSEPVTAPGEEPGLAAAALLDGADEPLALFNGDGRRIHANAAANALIGNAVALNELIPGAHGVLAHAQANGSATLPFGVLQIQLHRIKTTGAPAFVAAFTGPARGVASSIAAAPTPAPARAPAPPPPPSPAPPTAAAPARPATPAPVAAPATQAPAAHPMEASDDERRALDALMDKAGSGTRFFWESDAEGRITNVSPELAATVGEKQAALTGLHWGHAAVRMSIGGAAQLSASIGKQETWSGVTVTWPVDDQRVRPVELGAVPAYDRERRFIGYRGFGIMREPVARSGGGRGRFGDPDAEKEGDSRAESPMISAQPSAVPEYQPESPTPAESRPAQETPQARAASAPQPTSDAIPPIETGENVVRLHKGPAALDLRSSLSAGERTAFREIANVIGSRLMRAEPEAPAKTAPPVTREPYGDERALLDRLPVGVLVHRGERLLYANRALLDWTGYEDIEAISQAGGIGRLFSGAPALGVDETGEIGRAIALRGRSSELIPVEARLLSTSWTGEAALVYVLRRNGGALDERIALAEHAVREAEASARELRAILDTATDGIVLLDRGGIVLGMNRSAEALFGIDAGEVEGRPFTDLFVPESHRAALDYLEGIAEHGVASVLNEGREMTGRTGESGRIPLFMTLGRVGPDGAKLCAVLRDLTQWKRTEEELVQARRQAEQSNSAKSEFLAKISHEIRTPLNAIIGFSEVMMEERFGPIGNERYVAYLKDIHGSGEHLISLINDLLDLSKIEAGRLDLSFASVNLNDVASQCMALMQPQANRQRIIIRSSLATGLPPVVSDVRSIRQIVLNLLSNSIKFTEPGGQVILSTALTEAGEVHLRVRDTGVGMSESEIATALEPFRQITTGGRSKSGGTGLGLPLTKALVEANRAHFSIKSEVNAGTLVEIVFPAVRVLAG